MLQRNFVIVKCTRLIVTYIDSKTLNVVETSVIEDASHFPYIPGLFSFRELPSISKAPDKLKTTPDLVVCDGQGIAHPRRFGLACHSRIMFDVPAIGCGKTRLYGQSEEPGLKRGNYAPLFDNNEIIGNVLRTQDNVRPVYVSVGHRISLEVACDWIIRLFPNYRMPETTRHADHAVRMALKEK
jgi:deoxyribonuclease V